MRFSRPRIPAEKRKGILAICSARALMARYTQTICWYGLERREVARSISSAASHAAGESERRDATSEMTRSTCSLVIGSFRDHGAKEVMAEWSDGVVEW